MPPRLSRMRLVTGAVIGTKLRTLASVPSGSSSRTIMNHIGATAGRITKAVMLPACLWLVVTAPMAASSVPMRA